MKILLFSVLIYVIRCAQLSHLDDKGLKYALAVVLNMTLKIKLESQNCKKYEMSIVPYMYKA